MHNHYWDLNECRWVRYVADEGQDVASVPTQRTDEPAPEQAPAPAL